MHMVWNKIRPLSAAQFRSVHRPQICCFQYLRFSLNLFLAFSRRNVYSLAFFLRLFAGIRVRKKNNFHSGLFHKAFHFLKGISSLEMRFRKTPEKLPFFLHKYREVILVEPFLRVLLFFPFKAAGVAVLGNNAVANHLFIFVNRIEIKNK